jgi:hypothetical protein
MSGALKPSQMPVSEFAQVCGCEKAGSAFCNFDDGDTGSCEDCYFLNMPSECDDDSLSFKGVEDCKKWCFVALGGGSLL